MALLRANEFGEPSPTDGSSKLNWSGVAHHLGIDPLELGALYLPYRNPTNESLQVRELGVECPDRLVGFHFGTIIEEQALFLVAGWLQMRSSDLRVTSACRSQEHLQIVDASRNDVLQRRLIRILSEHVEARR